MISKDVLNKGYSRLSGVFGKATYPTERIRLLHECIKEINEREFCDLIDKLIKNCRWPPLEDDFLKYLTIVREDHRREEVRKNNQMIKKNFSTDPFADLLKRNKQKIDFDLQEFLDKIKQIEADTVIKMREGKTMVDNGWKPSFILK